MDSFLSEAYLNMLATDLDGTLVGDDRACDELLEYLNMNYQRFGLTYITGRHFNSVMQLIAETALPRPDILVTDVGTVIHVLDRNSEKRSDAYSIDETWQKLMQKDWQPEKIDEIGKHIVGLTRQQLPDNCRVSYYADSSLTANKFEDALVSANIKHTFVFSSGRDIDILPADGGKGQSLRYIVRHYCQPQARILAAGDSGNDREMILSGFPAVIVGNARPELASIEESQLIYKATGKYAAGILEGWHHFYG